MGSITLPKDIVEAMIEHARTEYPNEACGVVAGRDGEAVHLFPMANADASPVTYRLEPKEQLRVFDELDEKGWDLFAIFHSHTHSEAYPSPTDRRLAFYPEARYVILSLQDREHPDVRAFRIDEGEVTEEEVAVA
jgi:proteasome lid subunit RPN8/RPN11